MVICFLKVGPNLSRSLTPPRSSAFSASLRYQPSSLSVSPLELTLTRDTPTCADSRGITPLESIANLLSPLKLALTRSLHTCPNLQQITLLESIDGLLSPLDLTLTKNAPVSPLESALTKSLDLKFHRIKLLQKRGGREGRCQLVLRAKPWHSPAAPEIYWRDAAAAGRCSRMSATTSSRLPIARAPTLVQQMAAQALAKKPTLRWSQPCSRP
jgi:hypothetical protein